MSNEELAVAVKCGNGEALLTLWAQVRRLAWKFMPRWRTAAEAGGLTSEDLEQVAFLALLRAVAAFDAGRGFRFSSFFTTSLRAEVFAAAGIRTEKRARDPLRAAVSLDAPLTDDEGDVTLADTIQDPAAEAVIEGAALRLTVQGILEELPEDQQSALYRRYWSNLPLDEAGRKAHDAALRALRHPSMSRRLREVWRT